MKIILIICVVFTFFCGFVFAQEKPELTEKDLENNTYYFEISDNKLIGEGAEFLTDELNKSQFVLLGEYHGSFQISKFTSAVIPIFHAAGCRTFGLEIGPVSSEILSELSKDSDKTISNLNEFNSRNYVSTTRRNFTPIPFFSNVEDAEFLLEARKRNWNLIGLDQEFSFSYIPLFQRMYENLTSGKKAELKPLFQDVLAQVDSFYKAVEAENKSKYKAILDSKEINLFMESASKQNPQNKKIANVIKFTTEVYYLNDDKIRKYYEANSRRVNYMKKNLSDGFSKLKFDRTKDKMLLKMGAVHTGRGFSPLSLYEIGNTLSELAEFNGNRSLHIRFDARYYIEDGKEVDALNDTNGFSYRFKALLQMGKKDKWTVIDLRPMRSNIFYARKYKVDSVVLDIFKNQDIFIIAPTDIEPKPNFKMK